jgi:hypothetical protein
VSVRRLLLLWVIGLFLVGCGGASTTDTTAGPADDVDTATPDTAAETSAPTGDATASPAALAPFGTVTTVDGGSLDGAELAGDTLALWFWAPW